jgi:prepilin-type N-terminal cleavage/methylation domain-containing protein
MEKQQKGFTLVEILIVVGIILLLSIIVLMNVRGQMAHATDAKRKTDLSTLSKFFEDYYNDHGTFPNQSATDVCGGVIAPYITNIPCDPVSKTHYGYFPAINGGYRICAKLSDTTDPAIAAMGCTGPLGCGLGGPTSGGVYNYCLASGVTASAVGTGDEIFGGGGGVGGGGGTPSPTGGGGGGGGGTPTPTPVPGYACTPVDLVKYPNGTCNWYADPYGIPPGAKYGGECPIAWPDDCPDHLCATPSNHCKY